MREPVLHLSVECLERTLSDADDPRFRGVQPAHELALVMGKGGLDEDDVHG
jgi:hypothetical protein